VSWSTPTLRLPKVDPTGPIAPLRPRPRATTGAFIPWRTMPPREGESVRWECVDGRWITIALGQGAHAGEAMVRNAAGQCEYVDSYEAALDLAKKWRTV
jgi:hypothetical protein